ncbi:MAG: hypothetical protein ACSHYA_08715 [Opitutaceae bacterium]
MKLLQLFIALILVSALPIGAEIDPDKIAQKLGRYTDWNHFVHLKTVGWDLRDISSSTFSSAEKEYLIDWAKSEEESSPVSLRDGCRVTFILLVKFFDEDTLQYVETQFARGWYWARNARESIDHSGELALLPLAAKYLNIHEPSEPEPPMECILWDSKPSFYAANTIGRLLRFSWQSPARIREGAKQVERLARDRKVDIGDVYRRWWAANQQHFYSGKIDLFSSPVEYIVLMPNNKKTEANSDD